MNGLLTFANGDYTGAARMGEAIALGLRSAGHNVISVCGDRPSPNQPAIADRLVEQGFRVHEIGNMLATLNLAVVFKLRSLLKAHSIDYIVCVYQNTDCRHAALASIGLGIPILSYVQNEMRFFGPAIVRQIKSFTFGFVYRSSISRALCTSPGIAESMHSVYRYPKCNLEVLPSAIDTKRFARSAIVDHDNLRSSVGIAKDQLMLLNVGRIDEQKGHHILLDAVRILALEGVLFRLLLVGDVTAGLASSIAYRNRLLAFIDTHKLSSHVSLLGWRDDILELNHACDIYVHSSLWEGPACPLAVLEAMASGKPTVLTDCAGWPERFVQGVHGFVVPAGNAEAIAVVLRKLIGANANERLRIGENAKQLALAHHDISTVQKRFCTVCEDAVLAVGKTLPPRE